MISDERLRLALEEYDKAIMAALPEPSDCDHPFSPRFERKMRRLCGRARHPAAYKALQRAACILLALLALFGGIIAFNPDVRAAVVDWVKERLGQFTHYYHTGETTPEPVERKQYELGWLPEGYMLIDSVPGEDRESLIYVNGSGQILQFHCYYGKTDSPYIDGETCIRKSVLVDNHSADLYLALDPNGGNAIVWTDPESGMLFYISAAVNEEDLMQLASGVTEKKEK